MQTEILQLAVVLGIFCVVAALWLRIVYLPGRTLERWEDQRPRLREEARCEEPPEE